MIESRKPTPFELVRQFERVMQLRTECEQAGEQLREMAQATGPVNCNVAIGDKTYRVQCLKGSDGQFFVDCEECGTVIDFLLDPVPLLSE